MKLTRERQAAFLAAMSASGGNVRRACEAIDVSRVTAYEWRNKDPEFAKAWDVAKQIGADSLEDEAIRRAFEGVPEPVIYKGKKTRNTIQRYSDTLLIFLLKGARPEKYRDNARVEHAGSIGLEGLVAGDDDSAGEGRT
jgi:hypothetical protein